MTEKQRREFKEEKLKEIKNLFDLNVEEYDKGIEEIIKAIKGLDFDDDDDLDFLKEIILVPLCRENYSTHNTSAADYFVLLEIMKRCALKFVSALKENDFDFSVVFPGKIGLAVLFAKNHCVGGVETFNTMVKNGADSSLQDAKGKNALHYFTQRYSSNKDSELEEIINSFFDDISELITHSESGATPLHMAVFNRKHVLIKTMLSKGVDPNITGIACLPNCNPIIDFDGVTPLQLACYIGDTKSADMLLTSGAKEDIKDVKGNVASHYAVMKPYHHEEGHEEEKLAILRNLKCINSTNDEGITPLITYFSDYNSDSFDFGSVLIEMGANPNIASNKGVSPLMAAVFGHHIDGVKDLVMAGADLDYIGEYGETALHRAVANQYTKIACYLIKKGAKANIPNKFGEIASEIASNKNMTEVLELLINKSFNDDK